MLRSHIGVRRIQAYPPDSACVPKMADGGNVGFMAGIYMPSRTIRAILVCPVAHFLANLAFPI